MYTGTADGKIVDIKDGMMSILTTLGTPPCGRLNYLLLTSLLVVYVKFIFENGCFIIFVYGLPF